jgi:2-polyprenyl-6-methoxyphenol hydroxylase-like FAD-dependent oxidoreductase
MGVLNTAIVGGGVSGLALARGLQRRLQSSHQAGEMLRLYERRADGHAQGFGFLVQADGCRALRRLGIDPRSPSIGLPLRHVQIFFSDGSLVGEHALDNTVAIERPALLKALSQGLGPKVLRYGESIEGYEMDGNRVLGLRGPGGNTTQVDLLIGADGAHSRCRQLIEAGSRLPARLARVQEIVACVDHPAMAERLGSGFVKYLHPQGGLALGLVPLPGGRVIWFVQFDCHRYARPHETDLLAFALDLLADFPAWLRDVLMGTAPAQLHHWRPLDLDPPTHLVGPNLVLIGDAAHPMLPFTSQGVNFALADAELLAALLTGPIERCGLAKVLWIYEKRRQPLRSPFVAMGRAMASDFLASAERAALHPPVAT